MNDNVNHPAHYAGEIECIDAMVQQFGTKAVMEYCKICAFKYIWRCDKKHDSPEEDIRKAEWYIRKWLELSNES